MPAAKSDTTLKGHEALGCPGVDAMQLLERKWTLRILRALSEGRKRGSGLQQAIGDVNSVTLTRRRWGRRSLSSPGHRFLNATVRG